MTAIDSLMCEIKTEDVYKNFNKNKEMFHFNNYSAELKYYGNSNKLVVDTPKFKKLVFQLIEFVGLKPKMYSFLVDDRCERKKAKSMNKSVLSTFKSW